MSKLFTSLIFLLLYCCSANAQYYIQGEVLDVDNKPIQNVKIYMPHSRGIFSSGASGGFGIPSSRLRDSLILTKIGYDSLMVEINTKEYQKLILKKVIGGIKSNSPKLVSITKGMEGSVYPMSYYMGESYSNLAENDFITTNKNYNTSFSMRIDKAAYSNIRRFINQNTKVPPDAVRIDEMLNYFSFNYQEPPVGKDFNITSQLTDCPWDSKHMLLFINQSAKKLSLDKVPPSNFVYLIDVSGSMDQPKRLPLLKEAFQLLVKNLREQDTVSIVVYGGFAGVWLKPTGGAEKEKISKSIEELNAWGDTPGATAIRIAYQLAKSTFMKNGNNRIILATDGDFNVGQTSEKELENLIAKEKESGVYLTCLGVGMGNYKDSKIEVLAKKGNGNFAYFDDFQEAEKVLVTEFTQTLYSVASDVYNTIYFDTSLVREYRLIGYDNKKTILSDGTDELEGGEIGSGSGNTIVFEIVPVSKNLLKEQKRDFAHLKINYRNSDNKLQDSISYKCPGNFVPFDQLIKPLQFATAVTMYGLKLRESKYFPDASWDSIKEIATSALSPDNYVESEFIELVEKSNKIYTEKRKKKKKEKD
ncbi:MAG: von Willebrand factor type A domain-containing protein [Ginsengibacter sp.]